MRIVIFHTAPQFLPGYLRHDVVTACLQPRVECRVGGKFSKSLCEGSLAAGDHEAGTLADQRTDPAGFRHDDRSPAGHGFGRRVREILIARRQREYIRISQGSILIGAIQGTCKCHSAVDTQRSSLLRQRLQVAWFPLRAGDDQPACVRKGGRECLQEEVCSLAGNQAPEEQNQWFVGLDLPPSPKRPARGELAEFL